ncbi:MAG: dihydropteroate synthase [Parachlamydiaceae bacterium]|nr:dihydropteroate synthase [Parachlamydiaceae bacterium]
MGILNVTPDSCFDQGRWFEPSLAIKRGIEIFQQGADILDIGGESTRPNAIPVSENDELARVIPVINALHKEIPIPLSIDTMKPKVASAALKAGASFINDVSGFRDPEMRKVASDSGAKICLMHMDQNPQTMQNNPSYLKGIIPFLIEWFDTQINLLLNEGVLEKNIILDPGIGFGKTVDHNVEIVHNLPKFKALGFPVLIGLSRKSFLGKILQKPIYSELLPATLAINTIAIQSRVDIIRVHDISEHRDVIDLMYYYNNKSVS